MSGFDLTVFLRDELGGEGEGEERRGEERRGEAKEGPAPGKGGNLQREHP